MFLFVFVAYLLYSVGRHLLKKNKKDQSVPDSLDNLGEIKQYVKSYAKREDTKGRYQPIFLWDTSMLMMKSTASKPQTPIYEMNDPLKSISVSPVVPWCCSTAPG